MSVFILLIAYRLDDALSRMTHGPFCMTARRVVLASGFGQRSRLGMRASDVVYVVVGRMRLFFARGRWRACGRCVMVDKSGIGRDVLPLSVE